MSVCFWKYWALQVGSSWVEIQQLSWVELHTSVELHSRACATAVAQICVIQSFLNHAGSGQNKIHTWTIIYQTHFLFESAPPPKSEGILEHFKWLKLAENEKKCDKMVLSIKVFSDFWFDHRKYHFWHLLVPRKCEKCVFLFYFES